jgi:zinc transport system substrate-binding protein
MSYTAFLRRALSAALLSCLTSVAAAAPPNTVQPRVVVSLPPLHSLTARLLRGVATPELLMPSHLARRLPELSAVQVNSLHKADLVIWSGPELEGAIAEAAALLPDFSRRTLTLSNYLPIRTRSGVSADRDLRFWLDPRLAHHAAHMIAPALVRLYPQASDTILDNEIALMEELHHIEHGVRAALAVTDDVPREMGASDLYYLEWRFNQTGGGCPRAGFEPLGFGLEPGPMLYEAFMTRAKDALSACRQKRTAALAGGR